jgi:hypothetical protein
LGDRAILAEFQSGQREFLPGAEHGSATSAIPALRHDINYKARHSDEQRASLV